MGPFVNATRLHNYMYMSRVLARAKIKVGGFYFPEQQRFDGGLKECHYGPLLTHRQLSSKLAIYACARRRGFMRL